MGRGDKKNVKAFNIDKQRGEGSAERESMLRGGGLQLDETTTPTANVVAQTAQTGVDPAPNLLPPQSAFRQSERAVDAVDELPKVDGYEVYTGENIDRVNAIAGAISDALGGSEEAAALINFTGR
jgi:hypothetical protein